MLMPIKLSSFLGGGSVGSISLFGSSTSTGASCTIPAGVQAGDFIVFVQYARQVGLPTSVTPSGFDNIYDFNDSTNKAMMDAKIANGSEGGVSITGMNGGVENSKVIMVIRGDRPIKGYVKGSQNTEGTAGNPVSQTCTASSGTPPLIIIAHYGANAAVSPRTFSAAEDGELNSGLTTHYVKYKIYNSSPANHSIDMDDEGFNTLASLYFQFI